MGEPGPACACHEADLCCGRALFMQADGSCAASCGSPYRPPSLQMSPLCPRKPDGVQPHGFSGGLSSHGTGTPPRPSHNRMGDCMHARMLATGCGLAGLPARPPARAAAAHHNDLRVARPGAERAAPAHVLVARHYLRRGAVGQEGLGHAPPVAAVALDAPQQQPVLCARPVAARLGRRRPEQQLRQEARLRAERGNKPGKGAVGGRSGVELGGGCL